MKNPGNKQGSSASGMLKLRYGLAENPPIKESAFYALQWLAISLPFVVILGTVCAGHHYADPELRTLYLQKAAFITGLMLFAQAFFGHRLTLIAGPAAALLLGIVGSQASPDAIYTATLLSGLLLALISAAGFFGALRSLFTPRVTAAVLLLIAFTMAPTIVRLLISGEGGTTAGRLGFATLYILALFLGHRFLPPAARSLLIVGGMLAGMAVFTAFFGIGSMVGKQKLWAVFFTHFTVPVFDAGTFLSFLFCFLALSLNEIGSLQAIAPLLQPIGMDRRIRRGMTVTGIINAIAGLLGVIGPVDYSLSPGVVAASGCGSRLPLIPAALLLILASFSPLILGTAEAIPPTVVGGILVYVLAGQIAAGLTTAFANRSFSFEDGLVIALPLLAGTVTAILPPSILAELPLFLRSIAGNGFVVGVIAVLVLDQIYRSPAGRAATATGTAGEFQ